jgi:hypothetical protein
MLGAMDTSTVLMLGVLFGAIGFGYIIYGRKQQRGIALLSGVLLCAIPYFVPNVFLILLIGIVLMTLPFFIRY